MVTSLLLMYPARRDDKRATLWKYSIHSNVDGVVIFNGFFLERFDVEWMIMWKNVGPTKNPGDVFIVSKTLLNISRIRPSLRPNVWIASAARAICLTCCVPISAKTLSPSAPADWNTEIFKTLVLFSDFSSNLFVITWLVSSSLDRTHFRYSWRSKFLYLKFTLNACVSKLFTKAKRRKRVNSESVDDGLDCVELIVGEEKLLKIDTIPKIEKWIVEVEKYVLTGKCEVQLRVEGRRVLFRKELFGGCLNRQTEPRQKSYNMTF